MSRNRRSIEIIAVLSVMLLLLAACGSNAVEPVVQEEPAEVAAPIEEQPEVETVDEAPVGEPSDEEQPEEATSGFTPGFELGDDSLIATDPGTVSLASGEIQVLEFFAFW
ncbi:MAG: hypothetical protein HND51_14375 [Chloroflexi bacterium]|nr:hypothetical protein [Chloroflexota bacterium]